MQAKQILYQATWYLGHLLLYNFTGHSAIAYNITPCNKIHHHLDTTQTNYTNTPGLSKAVVKT